MSLVLVTHTGLRLFVVEYTSLIVTCTEFRTDSKCLLDLETIYLLNWSFHIRVPPTSCQIDYVAVIIDPLYFQQSEHLL